MLGIFARSLAIELGLVEFFKKLGDEETLCEVRNHEKTNHIKGLLKTTNVTEHVQYRVHLTIINVIPLFEANINRNYRPVITTDLVIIAFNVLDLREYIFVLLS